MTIELEEEERQQILLGLALLSLRSPGFAWFNGEIAQKLQGREILESFMNSNRPSALNLISQGGRDYAIGKILEKHEIPEHGLCTSCGMESFVHEGRSRCCDAPIKQ